METIIKEKASTPTPEIVTEEPEFELDDIDTKILPPRPRYCKDIMRNKREIPPSTVKLTKECSAAIANEAPEKKRDPGCPTIPCSIGSLMFEEHFVILVQV